jgi:protein-tyrosine phosphatase
MSHGRLLLVDDEPAILKSYAHALSEAGFDVAQASDGEDALRRIEHSQFEAILSDISLPKIDGIVIPHDLYVVMKEPAPMAGMYFPRGRTPWKNLSSAGFGSIVCLVDQQVFYNPLPLKVLYSAELEDLHHGNYPRDPVRQERLVREATRAIVKEIDRGKGVIVHCAGGTGRTGTVIGCVLREFSLSADAVIGYLDDINKRRGVRGWPESEWQAEMVRKY